MSVRRLSAEQPASFAWTDASREEHAFWLAKYPDARKRSAVIPLLWLAQKQEGWLTEPAMRVIAEELEMPYMRVYEVATFYTMFNLAPAGEHLVQVCGTTPCWLRGADDIKRVCEERIGAKGALRSDGKLSWMEVECLGACVNAPMVQISNGAGDHYYEDLTAESFGEILDALEAGTAPTPGPRVERQTSAPQGGAQTLTDPALYDGSAAEPLAAIPNAPGAEPAGDAEGGQ